MIALISCELSDRAAPLRLQRRLYELLLCTASPTALSPLGCLLIYRDRKLCQPLTHSKRFFAMVDVIFRFFLDLRALSPSVFNNLLTLLGEILAPYSFIWSAICLWYVSVIGRTPATEETIRTTAVYRLAYSIVIVIVTTGLFAHIPRQEIVSGELSDRAAPLRLQRRLYELLLCTASPTALSLSLSPLGCLLIPRQEIVSGELSDRAPLRLQRRLYELLLCTASPTAFLSLSLSPLGCLLIYRDRKLCQRRLYELLLYRLPTALSLSVSPLGCLLIPRQEIVSGELSDRGATPATEETIRTTAVYRLAYSIVIVIVTTGLFAHIPRQEIVSGELSDRAAPLRLQRRLYELLLCTASPTALSLSLSPLGCLLIYRDRKLCQVN
ncbi:hypothetical protein J6590_037692 [Homalodisca vitripennis]|nr:hypothetical protein J6590_037692 [Homalodisca vitripennis]